MRIFTLIGLLAFCSVVNAKLITIEPDDFSYGTDLSSVSPYVTLSTTGGAPVYSSTIERFGERPADGNDTRHLGEKVFSREPDDNPEWYYWRDQNPDGTAGLQITFHQPVSYFSLLFADLYSDAGGVSGDPTPVYFYDFEDNYLGSACGDCVDRHYLGVLEGYPAWPIFDFSSIMTDVQTIIVGGESEPLTIDRLEFAIAIPEPSTLPLIAIGLLIMSRGRNTAGMGRA